MKTNKIIISLFLFLLIYFGEIALSFSDKSSGKKIVPSNEKIPISFRLTNNLSAYESMQDFDKHIQEFMKTWNIVGASIAIVKDEKLVYTKGFGFADKEKGIQVEPKHIFRVASVSKLITAVAIMKLVEENKLSLNDTIFGENGILNDPVFLNIKDKRFKNITIEHLLNHSSGISNRGGDPMFMNLYIARKMKKKLPLSSETIIQYVLENRKLHYIPGKKSVYSNFGYAVLGKVIEKITQTSYENYVNTAILNPIGIFDMHLGKSSFDDLLENEVRYSGIKKNEKNTYSSIKHNKKVPKYYGGNSIETLEAAGAWVTSSAEMAKLLVYIDGNEKRTDILSEKSIEKMTHFKKGMRPFGWSGSDANGSWWRTGTLSGTSAMVKKQNNGISWVFIMNTTPKTGSKFSKNINKAMSEGLTKIFVWPEYDLFEYQKPTLERSDLQF
ncbi:MAG: hypothetical protein A2041_04265 [Bacteroidetes bacterium GWA2_31_9b]|nr:MAG: hypothetical protein A2041_04265 [Bacteroidetes bacterium GWA2_31_9b]